MNALARYKWSFLSIVATVLTACVTLGAIQYLYHHGGWRPQSPLGSTIDGLGGLAVVTSFVLAIVAIAKERPPICGFLALALSILSFFLYVR